MIRIYFCFCFCLFALTRRPAVVMATWRALSRVDRSIVGGEGRWRADEGTVPVTLRACLCVCVRVCVRVLIATRLLRHLIVARLLSVRRPRSALLCFLAL